jgi:predicted nucleotide-binding protein
MILTEDQESICEARLILADLTGLNANVMYELGIAHTVGKDTILINQRGDDIKFPFDLAHIRRIEYDDSATGGEDLKRDLHTTLLNLLQPARMAS